MASTGVGGRQKKGKKYVYIYISLYINRERERDIHMCVCVYIFALSIYIVHIRFYKHALKRYKVYTMPKSIYLWVVNLEVIVLFTFLTKYYFLVRER